MTLEPRFGFAIQYVPDVEAARRFYIDVLGLKEQRYHPTFVQFESFAIATEDSVVGAGGPELYWLVDDALAAFDELSRQAEVATPMTEMPFGKLFSVNDPAGHPCYILEFAANRPSQPTA